MSNFGALGVSGSALRVFRTWMDSVGDNIANVNTARGTNEEAFRARYVVASAVETGGVAVRGIEFGNAEGRLVHQPDHPLADDEGMVRMPDVDLGDQMTQLMVAQRGYQANLAVVDRARASYLQALRSGQ